MDVTALGKWIDHQVSHVIQDRRSVDIEWVKSRHILNGHHSLVTDWFSGEVLPEMPKPDDDEIRAQTNLMLNRYRRELGRRLSVSIKTRVVPRSFADPKAFYLARRGRLALKYWLEKEANGQAVMPGDRWRGLYNNFDLLFDRFNQMILRMNLAAFLVEPSHDKTTARCTVIPGSDILPLPGTATALDVAEGLAYRTFLSETHLLQSVQREELRPDVLTQIGTHSTTDRAGSPFLSQGTGFSQTMLKGAIGDFFYLNPSREHPRGLHGLVIGKKVYAVYVDPETGEPGLPIGGPPIPVWDMKSDCDWYGESFCTSLVGLNLEDDRQLSNEIAIAEVNRHGGWTLVPDNVSINDLQSQLGGFLSYPTSYLGLERRDLFYNVRPPQLGAEVPLVSARIGREADETSGHFALSRGESTGRIDSDLANERLRLGHPCRHLAAGEVDCRNRPGRVAARTRPCSAGHATDERSRQRRGRAARSQQPFGYVEDARGTTGDE
jgi:hypothetical protein